MAENPEVDNELVDAVVEEYLELLNMPKEREIQEVRVGLKELVIGLLAIGIGAVTLGAGYIAIRNYLEKKKYGYYIEKGGEALSVFAQLLAQMEGGKGERKTR